MRKLVFSFLFVAIWSSLAGSFLTACSSSEKKSDTAEGTYAIAQDYEKDERYEEAIQSYSDVKNKFPYSRYAPLAELAIGDVNYKKESYPEAQAAYQLFKEFHPKHEKIDYVTFRLGMSYFNQLPSTIDRDLSLANNAISSFEEVINYYPKSEFVTESKSKREEALKMLAQKENYIAEFYYKREKYDSALNRYENLLKKYPNLGLDPAALKGAALSASKAGDGEKAQKYLGRLKAEFPNADETRDAESELKR